jgi:hypothetical protein
VSDPLLDAHREAPLGYAISGPQPISIRDQILRGTTIAERLIGRGEIGTTRPLVVIGAGAGGASAAMTASRHGVTTTLVEQGSAPFRTQSFSLSRLINPTQYDWPLDHFGTRRLPWQLSHPPLPLPFTANRARLLSLHWWGALRRHSTLYPTLTLLTGRFLGSVTPLRLGAMQSLRIVLDDSTTIHAGAIIDAKGFGAEGCVVESAGKPAYEGSPFWGPDTFDRLDPIRHNVLISGSGDGALQDYLRVVTHLPSAADIVAGCNLPFSVLNAVQSAEDRSLRGRSWASDDRPFRSAEEDPYFRELEMEHRKQVARALSFPLVNAGLQRTVPRRVVPVHLVYREDFITAYYGLNRFLTLLLSEFILRRDKWTTVFPGATISSIVTDPTDFHDCVDPVTYRAKGTYDPSGTMLLLHDCFDRRHNVTFNGSTAPPPGTYNVVIVRHGLQKAPTLKLTRTRHLLPYHRA